VKRLEPPNDVFENLTALSSFERIFEQSFRVAPVPPASAETHDRERTDACTTEAHPASIGRWQAANKVTTPHLRARILRHQKARKYA